MIISIAFVKYASIVTCQDSMSHQSLIIIYQNWSERVTYEY